MNAKNSVWVGQETDRRGQEMLDWATQTWLKIENHHDSPPTFRNTRGKSWVDLTMSNITRITNWTVSQEETLSDHAYITYQLNIGKVNTEKKTNKIRLEQYRRREN